MRDANVTYAISTLLLRDLLSSYRLYLLAYSHRTGWDKLLMIRCDDSVWVGRTRFITQLLFPHTVDPTVDLVVVSYFGVVVGGFQVTSPSLLPVEDPLLTEGSSEPGPYHCCSSHIIPFHLISQCVIITTALLPLIAGFISV